MPVKEQVVRHYPKEVVHHRKSSPARVPFAENIEVNYTTRPATAVIHNEPLDPRLNALIDEINKKREVGELY